MLNRRSSAPIAPPAAPHESHAPHAPHAPHVRHVDQDGGDAFVPDYRHGFVASADGDAEALGEEFIASATSAEAVAEDARDEVLAEELGGFSVESAEGDDE